MKTKQICCRIFFDIDTYDKAIEIVKTYNIIEEMIPVVEWELFDDNSICIEYNDGSFSSGLFSINNIIDVEKMYDNDMTWFFYYDMVKSKLIVNRVYINN